MLGDRLRNKMKLYGHPACINTAKVLFTAAEKGVDMETHPVDPAALPQEVAAISPFGSVPVLQDVDLVVYGTPAIMSYLDDKGFGPSLLPRNGVVRAVNYQWSHIATDHVQPQVMALMSGDWDREVIAKGFAALSEQLQSSNPNVRGDFICGNFCLADIHWAAVAHGCQLAGADDLAGDLVEANSAVKTWWGHIQSHPSTSKEKIVAYDVLPTASDIQSNTLKGVQINA